MVRVPSWTWDELEVDFITQELTASLGLGQRVRTFSDPAEKARVTVTKAIKRALKRIGEEDAELGTHLERAVSTGTFCSYTSDPHHPRFSRIEL